MKYILKYINEELHIMPVPGATISFEEEYESANGYPIGYRILFDGKDINLVVCYSDYVNWLDKKYEELFLQMLN
jgi:hypothetical protein